MKESIDSVPDAAHTLLVPNIKVTPMLVLNVINLDFNLFLFYLKLFIKFFINPPNYKKGAIPLYS